MKRWIRILLQLLSLVLFALILWLAGPESLQQILEGEPRDLLLALFLYGAAGAISASRLRLIAHALAGKKIASWRRFYYVSMTARALGLVLPRSLSGLGGKSVGLRALGVSLRRSLWTVMVDNLYDVLSLGGLVLPAILFLQAQIGVLFFALLAFLFWLLLAAGMAWLAAGNRWQPLLLWLGRRLPWLARRLRLDTSLSATTLFPASAPAVGAVAWTILLNLTLISSYHVIGRAVGVEAPWWLYAASFPITQLSLIIAVAPGGLGIFDLGWLGLLRLGGISQTDALTFVVAQRAYIFVFVLVWAATGVLLSLTEKNGAPFPLPGRAAAEKQAPDSST